MSVVNTHFSNSARIFQYLMIKGTYSSSNKIAENLDVFKININMDTASPMQYYLEKIIE